jgi:SAM-dependent methyltransferase
LSAFQRFFGLLRDLGLAQTLALLISALDDKIVRSFDRRYRVKTSGFIVLNTTSFKASRLGDATQYGPVSGWGFRRFLKRVALPRHLHFADLGCGLGRACILAADYGFEKVTGVDLAAEFCEQARANVKSCRPPSGRLTPIEILQMDAIDYCDQTDADVFFMFRPFSADFMNRILDKLRLRAVGQKRDLTIIYSERAAVPGDYSRMICAKPGYRKLSEFVSLGQAFYVFQCSCAPERQPHDSAP